MMKNSHKNIGSANVQPVKDEGVFNQLFREHFRELSFFARAIIKQELFAQDIVQECFIKVWSRRKQLADLSGLRSYLYTTVKNDCISYLRKRAVKNRRHQIYLEKAGMDVTPSFEKEIIHSEIIAELYRSVERLPGKMQEVVKLYYLKEMSSVEIGKLLQKNPDTVQHQRKSALRLLCNKKGFLMVA